ncbi:STAS domain-containing protein [soil metagenome]
MEITSVKQDAVSVLKLKGRLDVLTSNDLSDYLMAEIERGAAFLVVDFTDVDYVSSSGLRVLLQARKKLKTMGGTVFLSGVKDFVKEVLVAVGFDTIFPLTSSSDDAVARIAEGRMQ